jgi:hypothetical protein
MRNMDLQSVRRRAPKGLVFSAKGATHGRGDAYAYESRFQRSWICRTLMPGAVPQTKSETAPLALQSG